MKKNAWFAATIALGLTVGFGARLLTGADTATTSLGNEDAGTEVATARAWTIPGVTVVVQIPAREDGSFVLANSSGSTLSAGTEEVEKSAEETWTMPGITVVAQIPERAERSFALASSAGETSSIDGTSIDEEAVTGTSPEEGWTMPGITVVAQVPTRVNRTFALSGPAFGPSRPSWVRSAPSPRMEKPEIRFWDMKRGNERRIEERVSRI